MSSASTDNFERREALLTAMILESYGHLADALDRVKGRSADRRRRGLAMALRAWATANPHEFHLELAGHFVGTADPTDELFSALVDRQLTTLGLVGP